MDGMATQKKSDQLAPVLISLPEPPGDEAYTPVQWKVFKSIMTTILPSVIRQSSTTNRAVEDTVPDKKYDEAVVHLRRSMMAAPSDKELEEYLLESPYDSEVCEPAIMYDSSNKHTRNFMTS